jgi:hypothetical protein
VARKSKRAPTVSAGSRALLTAAGAFRLRDARGVDTIKRLMRIARALETGRASLSKIDRDLASCAVQYMADVLLTQHRGPQAVAAKADALHRAHGGTLKAAARAVLNHPHEDKGVGALVRLVQRQRKTGGAAVFLPRPVRRSDKKR